ncbi:antibiotic biosynthesis monooxygenase [Nonomuraea diastatica]|uniref:antibiotic biosynthesis monooxygenase n=1 Tax=Nonomuraea diastatica TaxID=1848329 RepID=UPI001FEA8CC3|nr:antibiotic biosynthesis monooxygenase [Nonomuraea diastatica]
MRFVPRSVIIGFVNALAILMFMAQVPELTGVPWPVYPLVIGGLALMVFFPRITKAVPASLVSIAILTAITPGAGPAVPTVDTRAPCHPPTAKPSSPSPSCRHPHSWDASSVAALDAIETKYAARGKKVTIRGRPPPATRDGPSLAGPSLPASVHCLVTAAFDVDGPERQRHFVDSLIAAQPEDAHQPGAGRAHFLLSTDGSRVLLHTEWTSQEAHQQAATTGAHDELHDLFSSTPGVRSLRGRRYHLHAILDRGGALT